MTREHDEQRAPQHDDDGIRETPRAPASNSADAAEQIKNFAENGKGNAKDMPRLLHMLNNRDRSASFTLMSGLAKHMSGELFLECAEAYRYVVYFAIDAAVDTARPPASDAALRRYLRSRSLEDIVELDAHTKILADVRKLLPGPLGLVLPILAHLPTEMHGKQNLVRWYLETTDPAIAAVEIAHNGTGALAGTLDAIDGWSWLDSLAIGRGVVFASTLQALADATKNPSAKQKLAAMRKDAPAPDADTEAYQTKARDEQTAAVGGKVTTPELLDMSARAGTISGRPVEAMNAKMKGQHADDILQYCYASRPDFVQAMSLLLGAPDVTAQHVMALIDLGMLSDRLAVLRDDRTRNKIRNLVGRATPFLDFFADPSRKESVHPMMVNDEALRQWLYESKDPRTFLWLAAGSQAGEKSGMQHVVREQGLSWVYRLPPDSDSLQLRRFVLATKDAKAKKHVEERLIADSPIKAEPGEWDAKRVEASVYGAGDRARFDVAVWTRGATEEDILARISDLEPAERADVVKDASALEATVKRLSGDALVRAIYTLSPTLPQLFGTSLGYEPALLSYLRSRPQIEELQVAMRADLSKKAAAMFPLSPFLIFPTLTDPASLAKALDKNGGLLSWLLSAGEANEVLAVLSRDPARQHATDAFESDTDLLKRFPRYKFLLPEAKAGADVITKSIEDDDAREEAAEYRAGNMAPEPGVTGGKELHDAAQAAHLWDAIAKLPDKADRNTVLALIRNYGKDTLEVISGRHPATVTKIRDLTRLSPQIVFPHVGINQLLAGPETAPWFLEREVPFMLLGLLANNVPAQRQLGRLIDAAGPEIDTWLGQLPTGAGLQPVERQVLDDLRVHVGNEEMLRRLFVIRFGSGIEGFDGKRTRQLWAVLRRLPPAQINQKEVDKFRSEAVAGAAGYWDAPDVVVSNKTSDFAEPDVAYDNAPELTAAEMKSYYGLDDAAFAKAIDPKTGWITEVNGKYRAKPIKTEKFRATVIHEVGHAVDTMLGERTELVFQLAGWKNYGLDQIEEWAKDMGALDGAKDADKKQIVEAWRHALRTRSKISELVPDGHPAMSKSLAHVPLVKAGLDDSLFAHEEKRTVNGRAGLTGNNQGTIATVPKATADVAPSAYSLSAPGEFFAECYVEYYRDYDGTPATDPLKGGKLAPWIKKWFDENVDKIELSPQRKLGSSDPANPKAGRA